MINNKVQRKAQIPVRQIFPSEMAIQVEAAQDAMSSVGIAVGANFIISLIFAGILQEIWGLINTLQMMVMTVLFSVAMPLNAGSVMMTIMQFTNFDIVDTSDLFVG